MTCQEPQTVLVSFSGRGQLFSGQCRKLGAFIHGRHGGQLSISTDWPIARSQAHRWKTLAFRGCARCANTLVRMGDSRVARFGEARMPHPVTVLCINLAALPTSGAAVIEWARVLLILASIAVDMLVSFPLPPCRACAGRSCRGMAFVCRRSKNGRKVYVVRMTDN